MARRRIETTLDTLGDRVLRTPTIEMLVGIVWGLNTPVLHYPPGTKQPPLDLTEYNRHLRTLIEKWKDSGPNLERLFNRYPEMKDHCANGRTELLTTPTGRAWLDWKPDPQGVDPKSSKYAAICHFLGFIINPHCERLGGPCARCHKYFVKRRSSQDKYCSRRCATSATAVSSTQARRKADHDKKIAAAEARIAAFMQSGSAGDWKRWIARRGAISVSWLTRAVNRGWIIAPEIK
jgi:hypothetical protein